MVGVFFLVPWGSSIAVGILEVLVEGREDTSRAPRGCVPPPAISSQRRETLQERGIIIHHYDTYEHQRSATIRKMEEEGGDGKEAGKLPGGAAVDNGIK